MPNDEQPKQVAGSALRLIEQQYPRIAAEIRDRWGTEQFDLYLDSLLIDDRGNRSGFPPDVAEALLTLSSEHTRRYPRSASQDPWHWSDPTSSKLR